MPPCLFGGKFARAAMNWHCRDKEKALFSWVNSKEAVVPQNAIFRIRTKQYQLKRSLKVENGEQLKSDGLASLKVLSATAKRHAST